MRIGVDFRIVGRHKGGMAVYVKNLIDELQHIDSENNYVLLDDRYLEGWGWWQKLSWSVGEQIWLQYRLLKVFKDQKLNMGVFPNPPVPFLLPVPIVLTIADLAFIFDPDMPKWIKVYLWVMYFLSAHKAARVVTFSHNSKRDISKMLKVDPQKILVLPLAAAAAINFQPTQTIAHDLKQHHINQPFILAVPGTFLPRKNMADLLMAFADFCGRSRIPYQLVIVGIPAGINYQQTVQLSQKLGIPNQVVFAGRVDDAQLSSLYCGASLFVCTSLYEGFGLPILEAMKCGTPVISYANSALPEVVGEAGILVNNSTQLSQALLQVLKSRTLQNSLKRKGLKRAAAYSWHKTATAFLTSLPKNVN